ncbi:porin [Thalassotalea euphylliae]|uniref:Porin n=1 Tax=Thalassotalea euphylliae TaxID=1655234 RepID=A0A3E0UEE3_9GAMM|nr:porin [Thalassotalea euphylliae]REL35266.1 porin [Thalassotalea euphylliae]
MKRSLLALALTAALPLSSAQAELSFNGFANIVAGKASSGDSQWGHDDDVNFKQDSLFALQASTDLGKGIGATVQIISRGENDWDTEFEWAYLSYDLTDNTRILAGRQRAPLYMYSGFLDVSYAYPWITPPQGVYDLELSRFDGLSVNHNFTLGEFDSSVQAFFGSETNDVEVIDHMVESEFEDIYGVSLTLQRDWLTLRSAYVQTDFSLPDEGATELGNAWRATQGFEFIGDEVTMVEDETKFAEFGIQIDYNNWLFIGEYTHVEYDSMPLKNEKSLYVTGGYRFDNLLVHLTYGQDENEVNNTINQLPFGIAPELDGLSAVTERVFRFREQDSSYYTLGARWDFHSSAALKVEYSRLENDLSNQDSNLIRTALVTVF